LCNAATQVLCVVRRKTEQKSSANLQHVFRPQAISHLSRCQLIRSPSYNRYCTFLPWKSPVPVVAAAVLTMSLPPIALDTHYSLPKDAQQLPCALLDHSSTHCGASAAAAAPGRAAGRQGLALRQQRSAPHRTAWQRVCQPRISSDRQAAAAAALGARRLRRRRAGRYPPPGARHRRLCHGLGSRFAAGARARLALRHGLVDARLAAPRRATLRDGRRLLRWRCGGGRVRCVASRSSFRRQRGTAGAAASYRAAPRRQHTEAVSHAAGR